MSVSESAIRLCILEELRQPMAVLGISESDLGDDFELVKSGLLDSMRFIELLNALEQRFRFELNLGDMDIDAITMLGGLIHFVSAATSSDNG